MRINIFKKKAKEKPEKYARFDHEPKQSEVIIRHTTDMVRMNTGQNARVPHSTVSMLLLEEILEQLKILNEKTKQGNTLI